jgi:aubergine-like protein
MVERQFGDPIRITTNFFSLRKTPIDDIIVYSLSFVPEVEPDNRSLIGRIFGTKKPEIEEALGHIIRSGSVAYSKIFVAEPLSFPVTLAEGEEYVLILTAARRIFKEHVDLYRMYSNSALKKMLQAIGLKQVTKLPKYYDPAAIQRVDQHRLEVWRGYTASFAHHMKEMLLNIDFSSKIIRHQTAFDLMMSIREQCSSAHLGEALNMEMKGLIVMAKYGNFKCYRIESVVLNENPSNSFDSREGPMTYIDYYQKKYGLRITSSRQPLIISFSERGDKEIRLVPELCFMTGLTEEMRKDFRAMNDIARFTRLAPMERLSVSTSLSDKLARHPKCKEICDEYSIQVNPEPIVVDGVVLPMEIIRAGRAESDRVNLGRDGGFFLRDNMYKKVEIKSWVVLSTERDTDDANKLIKTLIAKSKNINEFYMSQPQLRYYRPDQVKAAIHELSSTRNEPPQFALVIISLNFKQIYNDIKEVSTLHSGIPTQCVRIQSLRNDKKFDSVVTKLFIQIATKNGSVPWVVANQLGQPVPGLSFKTMVIGIDVFHDTVNRAKSVLGFVGSITPDFGEYHNSVRIHDRSGQEVAGLVGDCFRDCILAFYAKTRGRFYPDQVVVFRDGVADSQIEAVKTFEVEAMKKIIQGLQGCQTQLIYVIVNKKTNAKLFHFSGRSYTNPPPGTVVDSVVVPEDQSFYLIAHSANQGMASPTLYRIINNDSETEIMAIARLAYRLCFMYYNWTGGVKIPAPTMMAHKLAFIVGQSVHGQHLEPLRLLPWFF